MVKQGMIHLSEAKQKSLREKVAIFQKSGKSIRQIARMAKKDFNVKLKI